MIVHFDMTASSKLKSVQCETVSNVNKNAQNSHGSQASPILEKGFRYDSDPKQLQPATHNQNNVKRYTAKQCSTPQQLQDRGQQLKSLWRAYLEHFGSATSAKSAETEANTFCSHLEPSSRPAGVELTTTHWMTLALTSRSYQQCGALNIDDDGFSFFAIHTYTLHYITLHCMTLVFITLHYITNTSHYITYSG